MSYYGNYGYYGCRVSMATNKGIEQQGNMRRAKQQWKHKTSKQKSMTTKTGNTGRDRDS